MKKLTIKKFVIAIDLGGTFIKIGLLFELLIGKHFQAGIITMIHAFDPEMIILSGGIMKSSAVILPALQEKMNQPAWTPCGKVKLVEAKFPDFAALYGADYLVKSSKIKT